MSVESEFYKSFLNRVKSKSDKMFMDRQEVVNLYKRPKKDKGDDMPHITSFEAGQVQQADLLFLPDDKGFKYALVVVDCNSGITDAEPIKDKTAAATLAAIKRIYARKILERPTIRIEVDPGNEFKGPFKTFFDQSHVYVRYAVPGRHRQQGKVENRNKTLAHAIGLYQTSIELVSSKDCKQWVGVLPDIIKTYNEIVQERLDKAPDTPPNPEPVGLHNQELLQIGTLVRYQLDNPQHTDNTKLHGKFRVSDIRWAPDPKKIINVILRPESPPLYHLEGMDKNVFTQNQLQTVRADEQEPPAARIKGTSHIKQYRIKALLDRRGTGRNIEYQVQWYGYPDRTNWQPKNHLMKTHKNLIEAYDKEHP